MSLDFGFYYVIQCSLFPFNDDETHEELNLLFYLCVYALWIKGWTVRPFGPRSSPATSSGTSLATLWRYLVFKLWYPNPTKMQAVVCLFDGSNSLNTAFLKEIKLLALPHILVLGVVRKLK
jgi:hypothetical protein